MKILLSIIISLAFVNHPIIAHGQKRQFTLKEVEAEFHNIQVVVLNSVKSKGYKLKEYSKEKHSYYYSKITPITGNIGADIHLGFSNAKALIMFQWVEYRGYQDIILGEVAEAGYENDEHLNTEFSRVYNNYKKGLRIISVVLPSSPYTIRIILEVIP